MPVTVQIQNTFSFSFSAFSLFFLSLKWSPSRRPQVCNRRLQSTSPPKEEEAAVVCSCSYRRCFQASAEFTFQTTWSAASTSLPPTGIVAPTPARTKSSRLRRRKLRRARHWHRPPPWPLSHSSLRPRWFSSQVVVFWILSGNLLRVHFLYLQTLLWLKKLNSSVFSILELYTTDRPSMADVVSMLGNETNRPQPIRPIFTFLNSPRSQKPTTISVNDERPLRPFFFGRNVTFGIPYLHGTLKWYCWGRVFWWPQFSFICLLI